MAVSILAVLCAILLPPIGVCIQQGDLCTKDVLIAALLTLLAYIPGLIYALWVIFHKDVTI